jgi:uncharacterized protein (UPF0332 family)
VATWEELAVEAQTAAQRLADVGAWRGCVSRAYYSAYAKAASTLCAAGIEFSGGRRGPSHARMPRLVAEHAGQLRPDQRRFLAATIKRLYRWRLAADYDPMASVTESSARDARRDVATVHRLLKG